jgi:uncharacterized protein YqgC (DUF456 family)
VSKNARIEIQIILTAGDLDESGARLMNIFVLMAVFCLIALLAANIANAYFINKLEKGTAKKILILGAVIVLLSGSFMLHGINNLLYAVNSPESLSEASIDTYVFMRNAGIWVVPVGVFLISFGLNQLRKP